jgi:hypothetical protein
MNLRNLPLVSGRNLTEVLVVMGVLVRSLCQTVHTPVHAGALPPRQNFTMLTPLRPCPYLYPREASFFHSESRFVAAADPQLRESGTPLHLRWTTIASQRSSISSATDLCDALRIPEFHHRPWLPHPPVPTQQRPWIMDRPYAFQRHMTDVHFVHTYSRLYTKY